MKDMRAEFEAWARKENKSLHVFSLAKHPNEPRYLEIATELAWLSYQAAVPAQEPALVEISEYGEGQENECPVCGATEGKPCSSSDGVEHSRRVHEARQLQPAQEPCDMGVMCLDCQPRGKNGECPDQQPAQEPAWLLKSAQDLATHLWQKHYKAESPVFEVLGDLAGVLSQIDNMTTGLVREQEPVKQESKWLPIETAPKNTKIIVRYKNEYGNDRTVFAKYIEKFTEESSCDSENDEYDEATDTYYLKEGWLELIENWDEFSSVYFDSRNIITGWMPAPPVEEKP